MAPLFKRVITGLNKTTVLHYFSFFELPEKDNFSVERNHGNGAFCTGERPKVFWKVVV